MSNLRAAVVVDVVDGAGVVVVVVAAREKRTDFEWHF